MITVHGVVYDNHEKYMKDQPTRCRNGVCPYYNIASSVLHLHGEPDVPQCRECREARVMTGEWPVV